MAKKQALTLQITSPEGTVESHSDGDNVILGSGSEAGVKIPDPKVSKMHVMLKVGKNGEVTAVDLGSESGTRVGDRKVQDPVVLSTGDILQLGASKVKVLFGEKNLNRASAEAIGMQTSVQTKAFAGTGRNAATLFQEPLSENAMPTETQKVLQVALLWGDTLISVQHFADGTPVTIGEGKDNRFNVFSPGVGSSFILAQPRGSTTVVNVPAEAGLVLSTDKGQQSKDQLKSAKALRSADGGKGDAIEIGLHDRVQVSFANVAFIVRYVKPSAAVSVSRMEEADFSFFKIVSICIMASVAFVAAMMLTPQSEGATSDDIFKNPAQYVKLLVKAEKKIEIKKQELSGVKEGAKAKDEEGKFGKKDAKKDQADPSKKGSPIVDANKREEDRKKALSAGLLGAMGGAAGGASNVFGPGGLGTGINNALGGLKGGAGLGDAHGVGGLGSRGNGSGGGGTGLGLGGLGTKGSGRGAGGSGSIDLGGRGHDTVRVVPGKTTVVGGLSKEVIAKVIRQHQNEIRFCYEQELQKAPDLAGKVAVLFTIEGTGGVADANVSESTLNNSTAENCMIGRIRRWKFPEPEGGGIVTVTFPWLFKPAGAGGEGEE